MTGEKIGCPPGFQRWGDLHRVINTHPRRKASHACTSRFRQITWRWKVRVVATGVSRPVLVRGPGAAPGRKWHERETAGGVKPEVFSVLVSRCWRA